MPPAELAVMTVLPETAILMMLLICARITQVRTSHAGVSCKAAGLPDAGLDSLIASSLAAAAASEPTAEVVKDPNLVAG
jgi:hypothetical protein